MIIKSHKITKVISFLDSFSDEPTSVQKYVSISAVDVEIFPPGSKIIKLLSQEPCSFHIQ